MAFLGWITRNFGSFRTTITGIVTIVGAVGAFLTVLAVNLSAAFDGDPTTLFSLTQVTAAFSPIAAGWGLLHAKDNAKT